MDGLDFDAFKPLTVNFGGFAVDTEPSGVDFDLKYEQVRPSSTEITGQNMRGMLRPRQHIQRILAAQANPNYRALDYLRGKGIGRTAVIVGGGCSIEWTAPSLKGRDVDIFAVNMSQRWLIEIQGIYPKYGVIGDAHPHCIDYQTPFPGSEFIYSSQVDPAVLEKVEHTGRVFVFHCPLMGFTFNPPLNDDRVVDRILKRKNFGRPWTVVGGASTTGMRTIGIAALMGYGRIEVMGLDGSFDRLCRLHPYKKPVTRDQHILRDCLLTCPEDGEQYIYDTTPHMLREIDELRGYLFGLAAHERAGTVPDITLRWHGSGALPWMARKLGLHVDCEMRAAA